MRKKPGHLKISMINTDSLRPSMLQPRAVFDDERIRELAVSMVQHGVLQPLLVRKSVELGFEIIAGERRWRAARLARLVKLPCVVMDLVNEQALAVALVENIQREDLNPIEEALAYQRLIEFLKISQDEVASRVGKDRASIANTLRLLKLPSHIQNMLTRAEISMGHARALLSLDSADMMMMVAKKVIREGLSVRRLEALIRAVKSGLNMVDLKKSQAYAAASSDPVIQEVQKKIQYQLGLKTDLKKNVNGSYALTIHFQSTDQLNTVIESLALEI